MNKQIRCFIMEVADFIQDKKIIALLLVNKSSNIKAQITNRFDCLLIILFFILSSMMIITVPSIVDQKFNLAKVSQLNQKSKIGYQKTKELLTYNESQFKPDQNEISLIKYLEKDIINRIAYKVNNPKKLAKQIVAASTMAGEDPFFIAAVVFSESSFRTNAKSPVGALGLMQIMPTTGKYIAKKINYNFLGTNSLTNPEVNLKLGIAYLQYLKKMFKNDTNKVLLAYNWGPSNVKKGRNPPNISLKYSKKIHRLKNKWKTEFISGYPNTNLLALNL